MFLTKSKICLPILACGLVIAIACFNIFWRLTTTRVEEWDESRRGVSAYEMFKSDSLINYIAPTYRGEFDYWSSKPPLGLWLIAASYKLNGTNRFGLRFPFAVSGVFTIMLVALIAYRMSSWRTAVISSLILATLFPYLFDHSVRNGEHDGLLVFLVTLAFFISEANLRDLVKGLALGCIVGLSFLLKSFAAIFPLVIVGVWLLRNHRKVNLLNFSVPFIILPLVIIGPWAILRYQIDGVLFFQSMLHNDLVDRTLSSVEGHKKGAFWYFGRLLKESWPWNIVSLALVILAIREKALRQFCKDNIAAVIWLAVPLVIASLMRTKISWYILSVYPAFALCTALLMEKFINRKWILVTLILASIIAEGRVIQRVISKSRPAAEELRFLNYAKGESIYQSTWSQTELFYAVVERELLIEGH